ncbi:MAG: hypothetical protein ACI39H_02625 [Lachnospiraceae bacterium]
MKKKLKSRSGETLVETLFSMLVIVLAVIMIAGSVVTAARVNKSAADMDTALRYEKFSEISDVKVTIIRRTGSAEVPVKAYQTTDKNNYSYYVISDLD